MLRIELTDEDLTRVRVRVPDGPLAETFFALDTLQRGADPVLFGPWQRRLAGRLDLSTRMLTDLWPRAARFDLVAITGALPSFDEGMEAFRAAPSSQLHTELEYAAEVVCNDIAGWSRMRIPPWVTGLLDRNGRAREELTKALRGFHDTAVAPFWDRTEARLRAEHRRLAAVMAQGGVAALLDNLHPGMRWRAPCLEIPDAGLTHDHLNPAGRGLDIVPSLFAPPKYVSVDLRDPAAPFVLFYPVIQAAPEAMAIWRSGPTGAAPLAALLGGTRASVLQALGDGPCTTTELATRARTSLPSASQHAAILRNAGLVASRRQGPAVHHYLTTQGAELLS